MKVSIPKAAARPVAWCPALRRLKRTSVLVGLLGLGVAGAGCAPLLPDYARPVVASPAPGAVLGSSPPAVTVQVNEPLVPARSTLQVTEANGHVVSQPSLVIPGDSATITAALPPLASGTYAVTWQTTAAHAQEQASGSYDFTISQSASSRPVLTLGRHTADALQVIPLTGSGFVPSSMVQLTIADDEESLGSAMADASGAFATQVTVPGSIPYGNQAITGTDSSGARSSSMLLVKWGGWPPLEVYDVGRPGPEPGQVTFTITGRNRSDYVLEGVKIQVAVPAGASLVDTTEGGRNGGGQVVWDVPSLDRATFGPMALTLRADEPVQTEAHVAFSHRQPRGCEGDACPPAFVSDTLSDSGPAAPAPAPS